MLSILLVGGEGDLAISGPMRLTIIVPAHNEESRIGRMLDAYLPYFSARHGDGVEFLVVVNGSTDRTAEVVAAYAARFPCLRMRVEPAPIGKGGALILGFREAKGDLIGFVDADGATPPEAFQDLVDRIGDAGCIIASRWVRGAKVSPRQPLDRRLASRVFNFVNRVLFGLRLTDTQCGAKLMRRDAVLAVLPRIGITRWAFDVDLLLQLRWTGHTIKEIPTVWHDVGGSKLEVGKASTEMLLALIRLRLLYSPFRWVVGLYGRFLGPLIHPVGEVRDYLLTHSLMLFVGAQFGNVCNMLFQIAMMRMMTDGDYGALSALLALLTCIGMPLGALSGTVTHFSSHLMARQARDEIKAMILGVGRDLLIPAALTVLAVLVWRRDLMGSLQLDSPWPLYVTTAIIVTTFFAALPGAVLGGVQAFGWAAIIGNSGSVLRLVVGLLLVLAGLGTVGALTAHWVGMAAGSVFALAVVLSLLGRGWPRPQRPEGVYAYLGRYMLAFTACGVLSNADVILVKHYFSAEQAGLFAKAATVARIAFFLPGPVATAMFPKVTSTGESSRASRKTLFKALFFSGLIFGAVGVVCLAAPGLILRAMSGGVQPGQAAIVRGMVVALAPLTLVNLLVTYELAQRRFGIAIPLVLCGVAYLAGAMRWHETPMQIVTVLGVCSVVCLAATLACLPWRQMRRKTG